MIQSSEQKNTEATKKTSSNQERDNQLKLTSLEEKIALDLTTGHREILVCIRSENSEPKNYEGTEKISYLFNKVLHEVKDIFEEDLRSIGLKCKRELSDGPLDDEYFEYTFPSSYQQKIYNLAQELSKKLRN